MTNKKRVKRCLSCNARFTENLRDSNNQWEGRQYCSMRCNNSSKGRKTSIFKRLLNFQTVSNGCWGWSGSKDGKGYGQISARDGRRSPEKAHRVSYELAFGKIPKGMVVRHKCDNPECTNPSHLELGTQKDNMRDCSKRGRLNRKSLNNLIAGAIGYLGAATDKNKVE